MLALVCAAAFLPLAARPELNSYGAAVMALDHEWPELIETEGREAVIERYAEIIDNNPGHPRNIELELQIARIYERGLESEGGRADLAAAAEQYLYIMQAYDHANPLMKDVQLLALDRLSSASSYTDSRIKEVAEGLRHNYPNDPALQIHCSMRLGRHAEEMGDYEAAEAYYAQGRATRAAPDAAIQGVSNYPTIAAEELQKGIELALFELAVRMGGDDPEAQLDAIREMEKKYPGITRRQHALFRETGRSRLREIEMKAAMRDFIRRNEAERTEAQEEKPTVKHSPAAPPQSRVDLATAPLDRPDSEMPSRAAAANPLPPPVPRQTDAPHVRAALMWAIGGGVLFIAVLWTMRRLQGRNS